jgi:hypothetical protein
MESLSKLSKILISLEILKGEKELDTFLKKEIARITEHPFKLLIKGNRIIIILPKRVYLQDFIFKKEKIIQKLKLLNYPSEVILKIAD